MLAQYLPISLIYCIASCCGMARSTLLGMFGARVESPSLLSSEMSTFKTGAALVVVCLQQ